MSVKQIKSIDISSFTIIVTAIATIISIIVGVIGLIAVGIIVPESSGVLIYLLPTIVVGTMIYSIFTKFSEGYLYNVLVTRLNPIAFTIENDEIKSISTTATAIIVAIITTIMTIIFYLASCFLLPLLVSSVITTLMYSGETAIAFSLYQFLMILSQPSFIAITIAGSFIITFVFVLIALYIYNILGKQGRGAVVKLTNEDEMTVLDYINPLKIAIVISVIGLVLNIILSVIMIISGITATSALGNIIGGFIGGFVSAFIMAVFYNYLAPKLGKLKIELID